MANPNGEPAPAPAPVAKDGRTIVFSMKSTPEYHAWVAALAAHNRATVVNLIDQALVAFARQTKFPQPAPKRNRVKG